MQSVDLQGLDDNKSSLKEGERQKQWNRLWKREEQNVNQLTRK